MRAPLWLSMVAAGACGGSDEPISVTVVSYQGPPVEDARIVLTDASGAFLHEYATDAAGYVELEASSGGAVSITTGSPTMTIFAVQPGDDLSFRVVPGSTRFYSPAFELPPLPIGATTHEVTAWCAWSGADEGPRTAVDSDDGCPLGRPVVDTARSADGRAVAHVVMPAQAEIVAEVVIPDAWMPPARSIDVNVTGIDLPDDRIVVERWALVDGYRAHLEYDFLQGPAPGRTTSLAVPDLGDLAHFFTSASESPVGECFTRSKTVELLTDADDDRVLLDMGEAPVPVTSASVTDDGKAVAWEGGSGGTGVEVIVDGWYALVPADYNVAIVPRLGLDEDPLLASPTFLSVTRIASSRWSSYANTRRKLMAPPRVPEYAPSLENGESRTSARTALRTNICP